MADARKSAKEILRELLDNISDEEVRNALIQGLGKLSEEDAIQLVTDLKIIQERKKRLFETYREHEL